MEPGHDWVHVRDETLAAAPDDDVLRAARKETRVLVTRDYDFTNVLRYPPHHTSRIVVIDLPGRTSIYNVTEKSRHLDAKYDIGRRHSRKAMDRGARPNSRA